MSYSVTLWIAAHQASLSLHYYLEIAQTHAHWVGDASNHLILCCSFLLLPSVSPSIVFFPMSQPFTSCGQSIGTSVSASVLLMNIQGWCALGLIDSISLLFKGFLRVFSGTTVEKHQSFGTQPSLWSDSHIHIWLLEKQWLDYI